MMTSATVNRGGRRCGGCLARHFQWRLIKPLPPADLRCLQMMRPRLALPTDQIFWRCAIWQMARQATGCICWPVWGHIDAEKTGPTLSRMIQLCSAGIYCYGGLAGHHAWARGTLPADQAVCAQCCKLVKARLA